MQASHLVDWESLREACFTGEGKVVSEPAPGQARCFWFEKAVERGSEVGCQSNTLGSNPNSVFTYLTDMALACLLLLNCLTSVANFTKLQFPDL